MKTIKLSWLRGFVVVLFLSFISYGVRAEYYVVSTPCCVVTPAFEYKPVKHKKQYVKKTHHKKYRHVHTPTCGHYEYSFSGSGSYGSYNVTVYEFYQTAPCCACGVCAASCNTACGYKNFETRYGYPYQAVNERYRDEPCYDPDLSTGDDNACRRPEMQIND